MKPKITERGGLKRRAESEQVPAPVRNLNFRREVPAVAGERRSATKNVAVLLPPLCGPNNILVPVDFSNGTEKAIRYAVQFAQNKSARIILLHVVEPRHRRERQPKSGRTNGNRMDEAEQRLLTLGEHELTPTVKFFPAQWDPKLGIHVT